MYDIIRMSMSHAYCTDPKGMTTHVLQADQELKTNLITRLSKIEERLAEIDTSDLVKTAFEEGRHDGTNMSHQKPLEIVVESEYAVSDHTYQVRDSQDKISEERLSPFSWKITIKPKSGRMG